MRSVLAIALAAALAFQGAGAAAQAAVDESMAVPVWNSSNGKLEAVLYIDTSTLDQGEATRALGTRWSSASGHLEGSLSARLEPRYGLLCGSPDGAVDQLEGCLVTQLGSRPASAVNGQLLAQASTRIGRSEWTGFGATRRTGTDALLPGTSLSLNMPELAPLAGLPGVGIEQNDLGLVGELKLGEQGWIRVGGSVARARLMPASTALAGSVAPRWNSRTLSVGGGFGPLGGEVVGRVVRVPGAAEGYGTLGLGLTWRTPWAGRLTVGAQNLVSTGENPVVPRAKTDAREEGRVPYVRYQQDL
jgi:hypothetical protein